LKPHTSAKGEWKWPEVLVRAWQGELAVDARSSALAMERVFFKYVEAENGRAAAFGALLQVHRVDEAEEKFDPEPFTGIIGELGFSNAASRKLQGAWIPTCTRRDADL